MAYKSTGKAGKSASGASMSKYDVEVEERLQALEEKASNTSPLAVGGAALDKLNQFEKRVNNWQESLDNKFDVADAKLKEWDGFDGDAFARLDNIETKLNLMVAAFKQGPGMKYVPKNQQHLLDF
tara:strand:- start:453 stop:827 length:375 start_codon:yes stop_codon:yes gene_type:complete